MGIVSNHLTFGFAVTLLLALHWRIVLFSFATAFAQSSKDKEGSGSRMNLLNMFILDTFCFVLEPIPWLLLYVHGHGK